MNYNGDPSEGIPIPINRPPVEVGKILLQPDGEHLILWDRERYSPLEFAKILAALTQAVIQVAQQAETKKLISVPKLRGIG